MRVRDHRCLNEMSAMTFRLTLDLGHAHTHCGFTLTVAMRTLPLVSSPEYPQEMDGQALWGGPGSRRQPFEPGKESYTLT